MHAWTRPARLMLIAAALSALRMGTGFPGLSLAAAAGTFVYWDQNEEEDFFVDPSGPTGQLIPPYDPNGQMAIFPGTSAHFVTPYNPTLPSQNNPGSLKPLMNPPVGLAEWDAQGNFTGHTIFVPGPYMNPGSTVGGDIPPDQSGCNPPDQECFNNNGTYTGVTFDKNGHLFAVDIGTAQGGFPVPDNGRLIEWFPPNYDTYCILFGPTTGGDPNTPHHVDGSGGLRDPGILATDDQGNVYVPEPGAPDPNDPSGNTPGGRVLEFAASSLPTSAADCPAPSNMPTTPVQSSVFIQGSLQNQPFPSGIARDPQCNCWAVTSVLGSPAVEWYDDTGSVHVGKGPVPAGNFNPFGLAFTPAGDLYIADIHVSCANPPSVSNPGPNCGPVNGMGQILRVTFTSGVPSPPATIAGGYSFPVSVTTCDPTQRTCPSPAPNTTPATPLSGRKLLLTDNSDPTRRALKAQSRDSHVGLGAGIGSVDDPTLHGGRLRVRTLNGDKFDTSYALPSSSWAVIGAASPHQGYRYSRRTGPITSAVVENGKLLSLRGRGVLGHTLTTDPNPVDVVFTMGTKTLCMSFGGRVSFSTSHRYSAHNAGAPAACPP